MAASTESAHEAAKRDRLVEEHIRMENNHGLEAVLETFGDAPRYEDESCEAVYDGLGGVREYYESLLTALPDLQIDVQNRHITVGREERSLESAFGDEYRDYKNDVRRYL